MADPYLTAMLALNPSAHYRLGASSGTSEPEVSGHSLAAGTYSGSYSLGQAGALKGTNDASVRFGGTAALNLGHPSAFDITSAGSVVVWFKLNSLPPANLDYFLVTKDGSTGRSWSLYVENDVIGGRGPTIGAQISGGAGLFSSYLAAVDGAWHMLTATFDAGTITFYVDGVAYGTASGTPNVTAQDVLVGERGFSGSEGFFDGWIDEVSIFKGIVLTQEQVADLYAAGLDEVAEPSVRPQVDGTGPGAVTAAFRAMCGDSRVSIFGIGDSNWLHGGYGLDEALRKALAKRAPAYATALYSTRPNNGNGTGQGLNESGGTGEGASTGAPASLAAELDKDGGGLFPWDYFYGNAGSFDTGGLLVFAGSPLGQEGALLFNLWYGTFPSGTHTIRPTIAQNTPGYSLIYDGGTINCATGGYSIRKLEVRLAANSGRAGQEIDFRAHSFGVEGVTGGFTLFQCVSRTDRPYGWQLSAFDARGGVPTSTIADDLKAATPHTLANLIGAARDLQGPVKRIVFIIDGGQNDESDTTASRGPQKLAGNTAAGWSDNHDAILASIRSVFDAQGWSQSEIYILMVVTHPMDAPGTGREVWLETCRAEAGRWCARQPQAKHIDLSLYTSHAALLAINGYDAGNTDFAHLSNAGNDYVAEIIVAAAFDASLDSGVLGATVPGAFPAGTAGYVLSAIATGGVLSGPNSVTVTFKDASNAVVSGVPFTILGQGSGRAGTSGGSTGVATFGLPNGTYTLAASTTNGVTFSNTTITVSGTTTQTVTGATATLPTSSDPDQCAAYLDCYGRDGAPESGVTLHYQMMIAPATTATSFNRAPDETPASDVSGRLVVTLARSATYDLWRGNGPRQRVIVGNVATLALPQILSAGST